MCIVEPVLKSYYLVRLPLIKRLTVGGLKGLLIGGLGFIKVFSLLKVYIYILSYSVRRVGATHRP